MGRNSFGDLIKSIDWYGEPINMNYRGKARYNTYCGTLMTILTCSIMAFYTIQKVELLTYKKHPTTSQEK